MYKIAIIGPESTGKSELAKYLSEELHSYWVPEYSREYCKDLNRDCTLEDELNMFFGQLKSERELYKKSLLENKKFLICDTTIVTVKVWCEYVFNICPDIVEYEYQNRYYDFYLLCNNDLPWQDDPLRNFPDKRDYFYHLYLDLLKQKKANFAIVKGLHKEREESALRAVKEFFKK